MELKVNEVIIPEQITFNYDELKQELTDKVKMYESLVYTDDQIKEAKADKATLNKLKKALNDERLRREKEYMKPFNDFKTQINEIISIIDKPIAVIDAQVKEYEETKKLEKSHAIEELFEKMDIPEWLTLEQIYNPKWLNVTCSLKQIESEIAESLSKIATDMNTLEALKEFSFEAKEVYKTSLDISRAIAEGQRLIDIQKRKQEREAELARQKAEDARTEQGNIADFMNPPENNQTEQEVAQWINFSARLTVAQAVELKEFFNRRNIEFKAI